MRIILIISIVLLTFFSLEAQKKATIIGRVAEKVSLLPIDFATVYIDGINNSTDSDKGGNFSLKIEPNTPCTLKVSRIGYKPAIMFIPALSPKSIRKYNVFLASTLSDINVVVTDSRIEDLGMVREKVEEFKTLPTTTGNFESILPSIALGTSGGTGGELSSQYNVRGGNYDENLVYVNDFEIYRPQLVRAGQQEGLTFPNINLIQNLSFSSGTSGNREAR